MRAAPVKRASIGQAFRWRAGLLVALAAAACSAVAAPATELSAQAERGKRIFVDGESESGIPITAIVSNGGTPIPASILPCAGCHGPDGQGRPEGGVVPPAVTWNSLTAANGHEHTYGRTHPAFDTSTLAAAVTGGVDPAGNALDSTMPRYRMSESDMADLIAYLQELEGDLDAGLTETTIRVGTLLPAGETAGGVGPAMQNVLEGMFADINSSGGIHGRRIELVVAEYGDDFVQNVWRVRELLEQDSIFALVGGYSVGIEAELAKIAEEFEVPVVGPYTQLPRNGNDGDRHTFYLTGGLIEQAAVLARSAAQSAEDGEPRIAIVHPVGAIYTQAVAAVQAQLSALGSTEAVAVPFTPPFFDAVAVVDALIEAPISSVLVVAPAKEFRRLGNELARRNLSPELLLPGIFASNTMFEIDAGFGGRVRVAYPSIPADHSPAGVQQFEKLHAEHAFGYEHSTAQISAFVAAEVLAEGLKRAGRALSREKLFTALEGLSEFRPGLMPALSYGRKHRIGAYGGYVLEVDLQQKKFSGASDWISLRN
ncbi:MAG: ABC transporter substrate-binding protein [Gammaproteobacteria bacterium]